MWPPSRREQKVKPLRIYALFGGKKDKNEDDDAAAKVSELSYHHRSI